jgi:hypothetical protein
MAYSGRITRVDNDELGSCDARIILDNETPTAGFVFNKTVAGDKIGMRVRLYKKINE